MASENTNRSDASAGTCGGRLALESARIPYQEISDFLTRSFLFEFGQDVTADTDLFEAGLIDSYGFIELIKFLEHRYGVSFSDDDLASEGISTLSGISSLICERTSAASSSRSVA